MPNWNEMYTIHKDEAPKGGRLEPGDHRMVILSAEEGKSKSGKDMITVSMRPSGAQMTLKYFVVEGPYFSRNMDELWESFGLKSGDYEFAGWRGAMGAAKLATDDRGYLKIKYLLRPEKAANLPEWKGPKIERVQVDNGFVKVDDDEDMPWA
jgi:hypothetical protein